MPDDQKKGTRSREVKTLLEDFVPDVKQVPQGFVGPDITKELALRLSGKLCDDFPDFFRAIESLGRCFHRELAKDIIASASMSCLLQLECLLENYGPIPASATKIWTKLGVANLCIVAMCISHYGIHGLARAYATGLLDVLKKIPLHSYELRNLSAQKALREMIDEGNDTKMDAAHYIGLHVLVAANLSLDPELQVDVDDLRAFSNAIVNMKMCPASENRGLHKCVDNAILKRLVDSAEAGHQGPYFDPGEKHDRLVEIIECMQSDKMQERVLKIHNGKYLYFALKECFTSLCPEVWNLTKDHSELQQRPATIFAAVDTDGFETGAAQLFKEAEMLSLLSSLLKQLEGVEVRLHADVIRSRVKKQKEVTKGTTAPETPRVIKRDLHVGPRGGVFFFKNGRKKYLAKGSAERKKFTEEHPELFIRTDAAAAAA